MADHQRIHGFDGLRAVAILLVLLWHTKAMLGFGSLGVLEPIVAVGWAGVDLFFGLSGFLITSLILREEETNGRFSVKDFYVRRFLRIFPPYYTVLLVTALILSRFAAFPSALWPRDPAPPPLHVASLLFLFSNYLDLGRIGFAYLVNWSLCVEEHFYLFWPATLRFLRSSTARVVVGLMVCAIVPLLRLNAIFEGVPPHRVHSFSHLRIDSILWGAVAALLFRCLASRARLRRGVLLGAGAALIFFFASGHLGFAPVPSPFGHVAGLTTMAIAVAAFVADIAATPQSRLVSALEVAPLRAVGKVSYGMYLLHFQAIDVVAMLAPSTLPRTTVTFVVLWTFVAITTYGAAVLMYRLVERPALRLKRHFSPVAATG